MRTILVLCVILIPIGLPAEMIDLRNRDRVESIKAAKKIQHAHDAKQGVQESDQKVERAIRLAAYRAERRYRRNRALVARRELFFHRNHVYPIAGAGGIRGDFINRGGVIRFTNTCTRARMDYLRKYDNDIAYRGIDY